MQKFLVLALWALSLGLCGTRGLAQSGLFQWSLPLKNDAWVSCVAFSPNGSRFVVAEGDPYRRLAATALVWDLGTGKPSVRLKLDRPHTSFRCVDYSSDGKRIVTGLTNDTAIIWDAETGEVVFTLKGHSDDVQSVAYSPGGDRIVTGSRDKTAMVWNAATGEQIRTWNGSKSVRSVMWSQNGRQILLGSFYGVVTVWDASTGESVMSRDLVPSNWTLRALAISPDQRQFAVGDNQRLTIHDTGTFQPIHKWEKSSKDTTTFAASVRSLTYSPDGTRLLSGHSDDTAIVWNVTKGKREFVLDGHHSPRGYSEGVSTVTYSPDGKLILTGANDKTAILWNTATGKRLITLYGFYEGEYWVTVTPDGRFDGSLGAVAALSLREQGADKWTPAREMTDKRQVDGLLAKVMGTLGNAPPEH